MTVTFEVQKTQEPSLTCCIVGVMVGRATVVVLEFPPGRGEGTVLGAGINMVMGLEMFSISH